MVKFNREVSIGSILQLAGYGLMVAYFAVQMRADLNTLKTQFDRVERKIERLDNRMDRHISVYHEKQKSE
jgi:hypothetical protein